MTWRNWHDIYNSYVTLPSLFKTPQKRHRINTNFLGKLRTALVVETSTAQSKYTQKIEDQKKNLQMSVGRRGFHFRRFFLVFSAVHVVGHISGKELFLDRDPLSQHANLPPIASGQYLPRWNSCWDSLAKNPCRQSSSSAAKPS